MALTQVLLVCLGLCLLGKQADAQDPTLSATALTVAENVASGVVGSLAHANTPTGVTISSQTYNDQFTGAINGANVDFSLTAGFVVDYELGSTITLTVVLTDGSTPVKTGTSTVTITVTDVAEEFASPIITACLSGSSYAALSSLTSAVGVAGVTATYAETGTQVPNVNHLTVGGTGAISVATGKTVNGGVVPVYQVTVRMTATAPAAATVDATVYLTFGCSSGAATLMFGSISLLLAMLVALLQ